MSQHIVLTMIAKALTLSLLLVLPVIIPALIVGLMVSIFQALTQIQESSLSFLPKLIVIFIVLFILGNWMMDKILNFTKEVFLLVNLR
jgi:flagellar biosynthetic protein FliQ